MTSPARPSSRIPLLRIVLALACAAAMPRPALAQGGPPLEDFVSSVARMWAAGNAGGITDLAPADGRIVLDLGTGQAEAVEARHVEAALRELFGGRTTVSARPAQVTIAGGAPLRGFGELAWVSRPRGVTDNETATVYVGTVLESGRWRIRELRVLR
jgi:hypothetical protein